MMKLTILIFALVIGMAYGGAQQFGGGFGGNQGFGNQGSGNQGFGNQGLGNGGQILQEQETIQRRPNGEVIEQIHEIE